MRAKSFIIAVATISNLLLMGMKDVKAEIPITGCFSVAGYLRYEVGIHTAQSNPNLPENHDISLSKFFLQTEWTYKPSDNFKIFANTRIQGDNTQSWDNDLLDYDAFPINVADHDWTMMEGSGDEYRAEVWELYADITLGDLWLRLGKQQIAWGEMIGARFLDAVNSVDISWNFIFEPEEFEILRIPNWMIRGIYSIGPEVIPWFGDVSIEAFVNPGDVVPSYIPDYGAPFTMAAAFPPFFRINERDHRGDVEYGFRLGAMLGDFYFTLNYLHVYADEPTPEFTGIRLFPFRVLIDTKYPLTELYGVSINYAWAAPNVVITFEGVWSPNQPYNDAASALPAVRDQGTMKYAFLFNRPTQVLPPDFLHASFMNIMIQFSETIVEGDEDRIVIGPNSDKVDKTSEQVAAIFQQPLLYNNLTLGIQAAWDPDDGYFLKPSVKYVYGDHWYFDLFATFLGGGEKRFQRLGSLYWADSVYGRMTFQF